MYEVRVHGLGGQGAVTMCTWVAQAGYNLGKHVQAFPFFGAERRGAPVKAYIRVDEKPIDLRCQIHKPDLLLVMSSELTGMALREGIAPHGKLLVNCGKELALKLSERFSREVYYLDATGIALDHDLEVDGMPMVNIPLFGAILGQSEIAPMEVAMDVIDTVAKRALKAYESATRQGFEGVRQAFAVETVS